MQRLICACFHYTLPSMHMQQLNDACCYVALRPSLTTIAIQLLSECCFVVQSEYWPVLKSYGRLAQNALQPLLQQ